MRAILVTDTDLATLAPPALDELYVRVWQTQGRAQSMLDYLAEREQEYPLGPYQEAEREKQIRLLAEANAEAALLDAEWDRRGGWTRYWLVTNHDGHVHRSTACSTTYPTTQWALVTGLSGMTEWEMVEEVGHTACTVCFPDAPVHPKFKATLAEAEAAEQAKRETLCTGTGQSALNADWRDRYTTCHVCGARGVSVTRGGNLRAHKTPEQERAEAVAAAAADPKKIVAPDGSPLRSRYTEVKTVISAWRELVSDLDWLDGAAQDNQFRPEYQESVDRMVAALAAKLGTSEDDVMGQARKKLDAKRKREARY